MGHMAQAALVRVAAAGSGDKVGGGNTSPAVQPIKHHDRGSRAGGSGRNVRQRGCGACVPARVATALLQASHHSNRCAAQVSSQAQRRLQTQLPTAPAACLRSQLLSFCCSISFWQVSFEVSDATKRDFPDGTFDVVISRDTLLHIGNKPAIFKRWVAGSQGP